MEISREELLCVYVVQYCSTVQYRRSMCREKFPLAVPVRYVRYLAKVALLNATVASLRDTGSL